MKNKIKEKVLEEVYMKIDKDKELQSCLDELREEIVGKTFDDGSFDILETGIKSLIKLQGDTALKAIDLTLAEVSKVIDKLYKKEFKELEKVQIKCVENSYNQEKEERNPKHFNRCDGDVVAKRLDILDKVKQKLGLK